MSKEERFHSPRGIFLLERSIELSNQKPFTEKMINKFNKDSGEVRNKVFLSSRAKGGVGYVEASLLKEER